MRDGWVRWGLVALLLPWGGAARAGAWAQPRNHAYAKASIGFTDAQDRFDADGNRLELPYRKAALYLYGEYGVYDRLTAVLTFAAAQWARAEVGSAFERAEGDSTALLAGDFELHGKYQFWSVPVLTAQVGVKLPLGYDTTDQPPIGTGEVDVDGRLAVGGSLYPIPAYATGDIGYRVRGGDFTNELFYNLEGGYTFFDTLLVRLMVVGIHGMGTEPASATDAVFSLRQRQHRIGGGLLYEVSDSLEVDVTYLKAVIGSNALDSHEVFVGVASKLAFAQEETP